MGLKLYFAEAMVSRLRWGLLSVLPMWTALAMAAEPSFPVPRALSEFRELIPYAQVFCEPIKGDFEAFRRAVLPYAPLDLVVSKASPQEAASLKGMFLGVAGRACDVNSTALAKSFQCGQDCVKGREQELRVKLRDIAALVEKFKVLGPLERVTQWGIVGEYRIDNVFVIRGKVLETEPGKVVGLIPSDAWHVLASPSIYLQRKRISESAFSAFLMGMKKLALVGMVREEQSVRFIGVGISSQESGLLFGDGSKIATRVGDRTNDGRLFTVVHLVQPTLWYYETR